MPNIPGSDQEPRELVKPTFAGESQKLRRAHQLLIEAQLLMQNESGAYPDEFSQDLCDLCDAMDRGIENAIRASRPVIRHLNASRG